MSSHDLQKPPKRRYYFAYHDVNGIIFPFSWAEEGGLPIGGIPKLVDGRRWEITEEEAFEELRKLEMKYPIQLPSLESPSLNTDST